VSKSYFQIKEKEKMALISQIWGGKQNEMVGFPQQVPSSSR
jgi:hypothetical protein